MAIGFNNLEGAAKKSNVTYMKLADGDNTFRIVGDILPNYNYWVKGPRGDLPFDCLQFDRENEKFNPSLPDPVKELNLTDGKGEKLNCSWAYKCQVINRATGKLEVLQLKKGMLTELITLCKRTSINPTDFEKGTDITVIRKKTGPKTYNVSYSVDPFSLKESALSEADLELVKDLKPIEDVFPLETAEQQRARLQKHLTPESDDGSDDDATKEAMKDLED